MSDSSKHYDKINNISVSILLIIFQAYLMFALSGIDLLNFSMIQNIVTRYCVQVLVQLLIFTFLYAVIHITVKELYFLIWKHNNKSIWLEGKWLHIHVKNNIRVGTVEIKQYFNEIGGIGHNISIDSADKKDTTWSYVTGRVEDINGAGDFVAYYAATKVGSSSTRNGVHVLSLESSNQKNKYTPQLLGIFSDTYDKELDSINIVNVGEHSGGLFFFRMSNKCKNYLYDENGFSYSKLSTLHTKDEFADEPYVIKLKEILQQKKEQSNVPRGKNH